MYIKKIEIGGILSIEIEKGIWISTKIQDIRDDIIWANRIEHYNSQKILDKDYKYAAMIQTEKGYAMFDLIYLKDEILDNLRVSLLRPVSELRKVQRRNSYRAQFNVEVCMKLYDTFDSNIEKGEMSGLSVDLSEFGMCICVDNGPVECNEFIECYFQLGDDEIKRRGRVVRSFKKYDMPGKHFIAINFLDKDEKVLKIIRKFIFELQKKMIKSNNKETD